jgi:predicted dehydrogenase
VSFGGRFALRDNGETPDTQDALLAYPNFTASWSHREAARGPAPNNGLEFCGTRGTLAVSRRGYTVTPDPKVTPDRAVPHFGGAHPVGGPSGTGQEQTGPPWTEAVSDRTGDDFDQFRRHARDFLEAVRSRREPASGLEEAHRVATACHLANLSLRLGRSLKWDAERETVVGDTEAESLLERPYRAPWDAERKAIVS